MAKDLNKWLGIGRLGQEPKISALPSGMQVANISIACSDDYTDKAGNKVQKTEWVRIAMFGKLAEIAGQYLRKGSMIYVEGKMTTREWEKDGVKRSTTEILASNFQMLDSKQAGGDPQQQAGGTVLKYEQRPKPQPASQPVDDFPDDGIPF